MPTMVMAILVTLVPAVALAVDRVALVIGNADYPTAPLRNPVNDARAMTEALRDLGFEVFSLENADKQRMEQAIVRFAGRLKKDTSGLFYYAGHGVQVNGRNYLVPVDAEIESEREIRIETVGVHLVLDELNYSDNRINIVILDACRNNPFERRLRGASRGLAAIDAARGTLIAYATAPGSVALDGDGANGLYTEELLRALRHPGLEVEEVFKRVRVGVALRTNQQQIPWESSSLIGSFVFNPRAATSTATPGAASRDAELLFWQSVSASDNPEAYRAYLRQYPGGVFVQLARIRLDELEATQSSPIVSDFGAPVSDTGSAGASTTLLAKAEPATAASAPSPTTRGDDDLPHLIAVISPDGTLWGHQCVGIDSGALAREASNRIQAADGFTFLNRWYRAEDTRSMWQKSGLRLKPVDEKIFVYGDSTGADGVLVLRYEAGGTYCSNVVVEGYLYDVTRKVSYREKGSQEDLSRITDALVAQFAEGRSATK
ncbi:MAG: hypothetical protein GWN69_02860 [Gammaproteobacteria bacterium]|nr:hypothetical protein [Gammaproteobacteria bacterium]